MTTKKISFGIFAVIAALAFAAAPAFAASDTWTGAANGAFNDDGNWGTAAPGNTSGGTASPDIASFNNAVNTNIAVDDGRTVAYFRFENGTGPFSFSGGTLFTSNNTQGFLLNGTAIGNSVTFNNVIRGSTTLRNINFAGVSNQSAGILYNINGNISAGASGSTGGQIGGFQSTMMFRGVIENNGAAATAVNLGDYRTKMAWLKGNNTFTGAFTVGRALVMFDSVANAGAGPSSLGNASGATSNISMADRAGLYYVGRETTGHATDRNIVMDYTYGNGTFLYAAGAGALNWNGGIGSSMSRATQQYNPVYLAGPSLDENTIGGVISESSNSTLGFAHITRLLKFGEGTWNLANENTYTGYTHLRAGTLRLDFAASTAPVNNIVNSVSEWTLYSGVLAVRGKDGTANTQTFNGTTLRDGYTSLEVAPGGSGGSVTVNLGALTRTSTYNSNIGHVLNVSNPSGATVTTSHTDITNGVLTYNGVSFATANKTDWATLSGSNIVALGSYQTATAPTAWGATDNVSLAGNPGGNVADGKTINTLRMTAGSTVTLDGNMTVGAGGILITGSGNNVITGGNLIGGGSVANRELIVVQNNTAQAATIGSAIRNVDGSNYTNLIKAGPGTLFLTGNSAALGANRYRETHISDGVLAIESLNALGSYHTTFAGGQLGLTGDITYASFGTGGANNRMNIVGSWGFTAYGADRTVTITPYINLATYNAGEMLLSSEDSDAKITVAGGGFGVSRSSYEGLMQTIRVFNGSAAVDAEIASNLIVNGGDNDEFGGIVKVGAGVLQLSGTNTYNGPTVVREGGLIITGSIANSMLTEVHSGAWLGGNGLISSLEIHPGAKLAPGTSIGTLTTQDNGNGYFLWNGETTDTAQMLFELSTTDNTSDRLDLGASEFLKGTGTVFKFDFLGTGKASETYTLIEFGTMSAGWDVSDFTYENLASGLSGTFALNANDLQFTVIPEPGTIGMALAGLALVLLRRRMRG